MKLRLKFLTLLILVVVDNSIGYSKSHSSAMGLTQTITFNSIPDKIYGGVAFALNASTDSNLDITYTSSDPGIASIAGNIVTIYATGAVTITASQDGNGTYDPATPVQQTLTINKATLIATANNMTMLYGDPVPIFTVTLSGFLNSDNETMIDAVPDATSLATSMSSAGAYDITATGGVDSNYDFNYVDGHLTINKATLTVKADDKSRTYGDVNPLFTITLSGFKNGDDQSNLDAAPEGMTAADPTTDVGMYSITASGGVDTNYDFSFVDGALTITQANLVATADNQERSYGDQNPELTITYAGFKNNDLPNVLATQPVIQCSAIETSDIGNYPITLADGSDNNYSISKVDGLLSVVKSILTITADDKSKFYQSENPALTLSYSGFKNDETSSVLTVLPSLNCDATQSSNAGSYSITVSGASDDHYDFAYVNGSLTINKAILTTTAGNKSRIYGENNPTLTLTYSGFVNGESESVLDAAPTLSCVADIGSDVGNYPITMSGGTDNNYEFNYVNGTLTISKATLMATADNKTKSFGETIPVLTITYSGFKNNDSESGLDVPPTLNSSADTNSDVGNYPITISGGTDNNYEFNYVNGTLTISKAILTATADNKTKLFGETVPVLTITYLGFKNNDSESGLDVPPTLSCSANTNSNVGDYSITISGGRDNNYDINYVNGVLTINKASQIITFASLDNVVESVGSFELTASSSSGLPVLFVTDNLDKITITNSTVSIMSSGRITITASQDGNSNYLTAGPINQTICILPKKPTITASGIGTTNLTLTSSSNSGNQWYRDNILLTDANNSTYAIDLDGGYSVQVTIDGCVSEMSELYSAIVLGLEPTMINNFQIYPIPAKSELNVDLPQITEIDESEIFVYDLSGRLVINESIIGNKNKIDVSNLPSALYILKVTNQEYTSTSRFIKE